jgi:pimeloyl-ACP methyl ester carboxylesterase
MKGSESLAVAALPARGVPGSVVEIMPECGHLVALGKPHATAEVLLRFLRAQT